MGSGQESGAGVGKMPVVGAGAEIVMAGWKPVPRNPRLRFGLVS